MTPKHGTGLGTRGIIMPSVELQARIKEQRMYARATKLKYRGVEYTHHNKPEEHEEKKDNFDEDIDLETALSTL